MRQIDDGWHIKFDRVTAVTNHILLNRIKKHMIMTPDIFIWGFAVWCGNKILA